MCSGALKRGKAGLLAVNYRSCNPSRSYLLHYPLNPTSALYLLDFYLRALAKTFGKRSSIIHWKPFARHNNDLRKLFRVCTLVHVIIY